MTFTGYFRVWDEGHAKGTVHPSNRAPVASFGVSVGLGISFGLWPARKAARLDPVDALRFE